MATLKNDLCLIVYFGIMVITSFVVHNLHFFYTVTNCWLFSKWFRVYSLQSRSAYYRASQTIMILITINTTALN